MVITLVTDIIFLDLIPFIVNEEETQNQNKRKFVVVVFDITTHTCEVLAINLRLLYHGLLNND